MHGRTDQGVDRRRRTLLSMAALAPAFAQTRVADLPRELAQAVNAYTQATVGNDVATLDGLVTDDYMLVNSDTSVQDKQSYLADFKVPGFRVEPYVIEQPFHRIWGDAALTGGLQHLAWTQNGRRQGRWLRVAHVWTRHEGRWRIAYTQLTRVPEERR
jgi:ketosteroid isomerase-like protein